MHSEKRTLRECGGGYVEVLVALVIFAVCLGPALNALSASVVAAPAVAASGVDLLCVKSHMEKIMAEPYSSLLSAATAAGTVNAATSYSAAADSPAAPAPVCPARQTYIARYNPESSTNVFPSSDTGLLLVRVAVPDNTTSFTSLVARP
jgi:hypothetical protein